MAPTAEEKKLLKEMAKALEGVSDDEDDEEDAAEKAAAAAKAAREQRRRPSLASQASKIGNEPTMDLGANAPPLKLSLKGLCYVLLFVHNLRTRYVNAAMTADEVAHLLESLEDSALAWLRRPLRPVVQSIVTDTSLNLGLWQPDVGKNLGSFFAKTFAKKKDTEDDEKSANPEQEAAERAASRIKVRVKALLELLVPAATAAPPMVLESLYLLCSKRLHWPDGVLAPSALEALKKTGDGSMHATRRSPAVLALNLLVTQLLVRKLMLQPKEVIPGLKASGLSIANLHWLGAAFHVVAKIALLQAKGELEIGARASVVEGAHRDRLVPGSPAVDALQKALELDAAQMQGTPGFAAEVSKLITYGLTVPAFETFVHEAATALGGWVAQLLEAGAALVHDHAVKGGS